MRDKKIVRNRTQTTDGVQIAMRIITLEIKVDGETRMTVGEIVTVAGVLIIMGGVVAGDIYFI